jgi:hypothetical protein
MPEWSNPPGLGPQAGPPTNPPAQPPTWGRQDDHIPSVACLLYVVADEVIRQTIAMDSSPIPMKVPCRRAWVHDVRFAATVVTATYRI